MPSTARDLPFDAELRRALPYATLGRVLSQSGLQQEPDAAEEAALRWTRTSRRVEPRDTPETFHQLIEEWEAWTPPEHTAAIWSDERPFADLGATLDALWHETLVDLAGRGAPVGPVSTCILRIAARRGVLTPRLILASLAITALACTLEPAVARAEAGAQDFSPRSLALRMWLCHAFPEIELRELLGGSRYAAVRRAWGRPPIGRAVLVRAAVDALEADDLVDEVLFASLRAARPYDRDTIDRLHRRWVP